MRRLIAGLSAGLLTFALCSVAFAQALPQKVWTLQSPALALGHCTLSISGSVATAFSSCTTVTPTGNISGVPAGAFYALVVAEGQIRYWDDGTAPTTTVGILVNGTSAPWSPIYETSQAVSTKPLSGWLAIGVSGAVTANIIFYGIQ